MKASIQIHRGELISPIQSLTDYFRVSHTASTLPSHHDDVTG